MDKSKEQKRQLYVLTEILTFLIVLTIVIAAFIFGCNVMEEKRVVKYNARLEELCEWIDGYEIVNVENKPYTLSSSKDIWTITRLNKGKEETITVEESLIERMYFNTSPIYGFRVSPDNKYHIIEDNGKLMVYRPNYYYDTVSKSKYSSK
jgi:hypothetical protein